MASSTAAPDAYRRSAVLTATPGQHVVMLYDGACRFLARAGAAMREGEVERAHNILRRAELIIAHLDSSLDRDQGQLTDRLHSIYRFCLTHLNSGRVTQDAGKLDDVARLLGSLREAWAEVALR